MWLAPGQMEKEWKLLLMGACTVHFYIELLPSGVLSASPISSGHGMCQIYIPKCFYFSTYEALMILEHTVGMPSK